MAQITTHEGITFRIKKGESFEYDFTVKDEDGTAIDVHSDYNESVLQYYEGSAVTLFSVASISGTPEQLRLRMTSTDSASAETGWYQGTVFITAKVATDKFAVLNFSMEMIAQATAEIPISTDTIIEDLEIATTFSRSRINRAIARSQDRALYLIPESVRSWCIENSWPRNICSWATQLAELYLQQKIYRGREDEFENEIKVVENMLENVVVDIDQDGKIDPGEGFGGQSFRLRRLGV